MDNCSFQPRFGTPDAAIFASAKLPKAPETESARRRLAQMRQTLPSREVRRPMPSPTRKNTELHRPKRKYLSCALAYGQEQEPIVRATVCTTSAHSYMKAGAEG